MYSQTYITEVSRYSQIYAMLNDKDLLWSPEECLSRIEVGFRDFAKKFILSYPDYIADDFIIFSCYLYVHYVTKKPFKNIILDAIELHKNKNAGYSGLHDDPWENFKAVERLFGIPTSDGILARATDKYMRFMNLQSDNSLEKVQEPLTDTLLDLAAYLVIYNCILDEKIEA